MASQTKIRIKEDIVKVIIEATNKEIADLILQLQRSAELNDSSRSVNLSKSDVEIIAKINKAVSKVNSVPLRI